MTIPWTTVLAAAEQGLRLAAPALPLPAALVAEAALALARILVAQGCDVDCPVDIRDQLAPADLPTGERGLAAFQRAEARARGLDDEGIAMRRSHR